jgi:hypothetical protein
MRGLVVRAKQFEQRSRSSSSTGEGTGSQRFGTMPQFQHRSSATTVTNSSSLVSRDAAVRF